MAKEKDNNKTGDIIHGDKGKIIVKENQGSIGDIAGGDIHKTTIAEESEESRALKLTTTYILMWVFAGVIVIGGIFVIRSCNAKLSPFEKYEINSYQDAQGIVSFQYPDFMGKYKNISFNEKKSQYHVDIRGYGYPLKVSFYRLPWEKISDFEWNFIKMIYQIKDINKSIQSLEEPSLLSPEFTVINQQVSFSDNEKFALFEVKTDKSFTKKGDLYTFIYSSFKDGILMKIIAVFPFKVYQENKGSFWGMRNFKWDPIRAKNVIPNEDIRFNSKEISEGRQISERLNQHKKLSPEEYDWVVDNLDKTIKEYPDNAAPHMLKLILVTYQRNPESWGQANTDSQ